MSVHQIGRCGFLKVACAVTGGRASQDNQQVSELYANYLGKPLGYKSEQLLHTKWFDKSAKVKELQAKGKFPNPRFEKEFADGTYPYE